MPCRHVPCGGFGAMHGSYAMQVWTDDIACVCIFYAFACGRGGDRGAPPGCDIGFLSCMHLWLCVRSPRVRGNLPTIRPQRGYPLFLTLRISLPPWLSPLALFVILALILGSLLPMIHSQRSSPMQLRSRAGHPAGPQPLQHHLQSDLGAVHIGAFDLQV